MRRSYSNFLGNAVAPSKVLNVDLTGSLSKRVPDWNSAKWNGAYLMYSLNEFKPQVKRQASPQVKEEKDVKPVNVDYKPVSVNQLVWVNRTRSEIGELGTRVREEGMVKHPNMTSSSNPADFSQLSSHYPQRETSHSEKPLRVSNDIARNSRKSQIDYLPASRPYKEDPHVSRQIKPDFQSQITDLPGSIKVEPKEILTPAKRNGNAKASRQLLTSTEKEHIYGPRVQHTGPKRDLKPALENPNPCMKKPNRASEMGVFQPSYKQDELGIQKRKRPEMARCVFQSTLKYLC